GFLKGNLVAFGLVIFLGFAQLFMMVLTATLATTEGLLLRYAAPEDRGILEAVATRILSIGIPIVITYTFLFLLYWIAPRQVTTLRHAALSARLPAPLSQPSA